ncbi:hypothetical protein KUTeg_024233 [Tegillarca granosa]|uniref:Protein kinase domain-containing protein n=1 Tax=Tegillarca granosa TaxID=220873 RepID=A0ABQ9E2A8_TEGGR|nr:hypothetical protein KUTeg_024233 [Tegillarca granosa]
MDDIFTQVREGNALQVRVWLDNTENDLNQGDDHRFSLLHWAAREGRTNIVDMLIQRGARINATNMGDDTALHLAASHGHRDIVRMLIQNKANINAINEHGNTPLHYACFWGQDLIAEELVNNGALVSIANKFDETPLEKSKIRLHEMLRERAAQLGQDLTKIPFKDRSWLGYKTRSRMERSVGRIFNHPNVLPVLACCNQPPSLVVISQFMPFGSLYNVIHGETGIVVDQNQCLRFAIDIARGMEFLHSLEPSIPNMILTSKHIMIDEDLAKINIDDPKYYNQDGTMNGVDEDLTARINMSDYKFSFHEKGKLYSPAWMAPEALQRKPADINWKAADMWSFAVCLWEMETREIAMEGLRLNIPPGISSHTSRLIKICMNEEPGKRPKFDMIIPILEKMRQR